MPHYPRGVYIWTAVIVLVTLAAAWVLHGLVREPIILDLSVAATIFLVFLLATAAPQLLLFSRRKTSVGFREKLRRGGLMFLFAVALSIAWIGIGKALKDIVGFRADTDYVELYEVAGEDEALPEAAVTVEGRATYLSTQLRVVTRSGSPFWFTLCAAPGLPPPPLPVEAAAFHVIDKQASPLEAEFHYDKRRDPRRRKECTNKELRVFLEVPDRARLCLDLRYRQEDGDRTRRSCWDLVRELDEGVIMLSEIFGR